MKHLKHLAAVVLGTVLAVSLVACAPTQTDDATYSYSVSLSASSLSLLAGDASLGSATLSATVLRDDETTDMVPTFTVSDPSIATVDEGGTITAKGYGKTTVTAAYKDASAQAEISVFENADAEQINALSEDAVNFFGRTYRKDGAMQFDNPVTGFEVSFLGDELTANVTVNSDVYVCIYVDGSDKSRRVRLTTATAFPLAEGLGEGIHTVRVLKSSEVDCGTYALHALDAATFLRAQAKSDLKMEFIGDSITAGYGNLVQGGTWSVENSDACSSYAYLTAAALDADFSVVALSGICVNVYMWGGTNKMTDMHQYYSLQNKQTYPYDADMDIVVLNLGTNDGSYIDENDDYAPLFKTDYRAFVTHLREIYPKAYILCVYGMMGKNSFIDLGIKNTVKAMEDDKIIYLNTFKKNDGGASWHPDAAAHRQYAKQLSDYITENILRAAE